jgi:pimeloyl-ACP methyl ester carboxylesterase
MPHITTDDGVRLHYVEAGSGFPILFVHEFAGDGRSWEPQLRHFSRKYRCVAYDARGYPPSDVPKRLDQYSQARAVADAVSVCAGLGIKQAHVVGLSMGAYCALNLAIHHPALVRSLVVAGCGYGSEPDKQAEFRRNCEAAARRFEQLPIAEAARQYAEVATRWPLRDKDPRGWAEFLARLAEHDPTGSAMTLRGVQMRRPSLWELVPRMRALKVPTLIITGDKDEACLAPGLLMRKEIPGAGLLVLPHGGHAINLEEPDWFNRALAEFLVAAEQGRWGGVAATGG